MLKKILVPAALLLLFALAVPAFAASDDEISNLQQQIYELQQKLNQEYAELYPEGEIAPGGFDSRYGRGFGGGFGCPMWGGWGGNVGPSQSNFNGNGMMGGYGVF